MSEFVGSWSETLATLLVASAFEAPDGLSENSETRLLYRCRLDTGTAFTIWFEKEEFRCGILPRGGSEYDYCSLVPWSRQDPQAIIILNIGTDNPEHDGKALNFQDDEACTLELIKAY